VQGSVGARGGSATAASATGTAPLTLINGDRVLVGSATGGPHTAAVLPGRGSSLATSLMTLRLGAKVFLVPWAALPYLGRGLDPRLFEVSALRHAERDGRLPVTVRYRGHVPALPGITLTRSAAGIAEGYLTAGSARVFGAALARQMVSDHASGSYGSDGVFADGVSVSLPGEGPGPVQPRFPMHTLTMTGADLAGHPDTGDVVAVFNVNDNAVLGDPGAGGQDNVFYRGAAKYSVPSGTYWAIGVFFQILNHGQSADVRLDVLPQFTVAGNTTVRLRAGASASKVTMVTPRPAVLQYEQLTVIRAAPGAVTAIGGAVFGSASSLWVNPTSRRPTDGTLRTYTAGQLTSPPGPGTPYAYTLDFPGPPGIIPPQRFAARPAGLATVSERYYQDVPSTGGWFASGGTAAEWKYVPVSISVVLPLRLPGRRVQYISARPATVWLRGYYESLDLPPVVDRYRLLHGGQHLTEDWNRYPLHPMPTVSLPGTSVFAALPSAVRTQNTLLLDITPFSDNQRGHLGGGFSGGPFKITGSYALYQDGAKIAGRPVTAGSPDLFARAALAPRPSRIRFVVNAARTGPQYRLSTESRDVWTWRSRPEPGATVPAPWLCGVTRSGQPDRHCAVQPMLTLRYQLAGLSLAGATRPGPQVLGITVAHLQEAAPSKITGVQARVSFNGGKTWQEARVRPAGASRFRALFTAPRSRAVTLQVTARDATGATVTETIRNGYRTSAWPPNRNQP